MTPEEMKMRTKTYALRVIRVVQALPRSDVARELGNQLLRAGTSVGANYRAACRGKSRADFINKLKIVEEECDESLFWMELLVDGGLVPAARLAPLQGEGSEILAIVVASLRTSRSRES
jgi:four helix bundle protein